MTSPHDRARERVALFRAIETEVSRVRAKWLLFLRLYASGEESLGLLRRSAPWLFIVVQQVLLDDLALSLSRLTEPSTVMGRSTVVLDRLVEECDPTGGADVGHELGGLLVKAKSHVASFRVVRNRRLAHEDLAQMLDPDARPLPAVCRESIEAALAAISAVMDIAARHLGVLPTAQGPGLEVGDADALLRCLRDAEEARGARSTASGVSPGA